MNKYKMVNLGEYAIDALKRYSNYVLYHRMIPNVLDNKTPVQRRCLFVMFKEGVLSNAKAKKLNTMVGQCMSYHPHGDSGINGAYVTMSQEWKQNETYFEIDGNRGNVFGDTAAAGRYLEIRMSKYGEDVFTHELSPDVVPYQNNYTDTGTEPLVLPAVLPDVLINGNFGIAVGYTTNLLPHNLTDVANVCKAYVKNRKISVQELADILKAPDFPLAGTIVGKGFKDAYINGSGSCVQRGIWKRIDDGKDTFIEVTSIPYDTTTEQFINNVKNLAIKADQGKLVCHIVSYEDHSNMDGISIKLKLDNPENYDNAVSQLLANTCLEVKHSMVNNVIINDRFKVGVNLLDIIKAFVEFRERCLYNRFKRELKDVIKQMHLIDGVVILNKDKVKNLQRLMEEVRLAKNKQDTIHRVMKAYKLTYEQAEYIVMLRVYRLSNMEIDDLLSEYKKLEKRRIELEKLTISQKNQHLDKYMTNEWDEYIVKFGRRRKNNVIEKDNLNKAASIIPCKVWLIANDKTYNMVVGAKYKGTMSIDTHTNGLIYIITDKGYMYVVKVAKIMRNPYIDLSTIIGLKREDTIVGMYTTNYNGDDISVIMQGEFKLKKFIIKAGTTSGMHGKRVWTGGKLVNTMEKYNSFYLVNNQYRIKVDINNLDDNTYYSYFGITKHKGQFIVM